MVSPLVKYYVNKKAKKAHMELSFDMEQVLHNAIAPYLKKGVRVIYSWLWDAGGKVPNASSTFPGLILVNAKWAALLVLFQGNEDVYNAFKLTMGHEMTHQENDYFFLEPFSKASKFVYWVNEVHADFGGVEKAFDGDTYRGIRAMQFKKQYKGDRDKDSHSHPSWSRRIYFITNFDCFDERLIREIAVITGCKNKKLVEQVCYHFNEGWIIR